MPAKKRYTEQQIAFALKQAELGTPPAEIIRKMGICEQTFYTWKKRYAGMGTVEIKKLKNLEEKNARLKKLVADLSLDKARLQVVLSKKALKPKQKREIVDYLRVGFGISKNHGCNVIQIERSVYYYQSKRKNNVLLEMRIAGIAKTRVRYGYYRIYILLRRKGWIVNHKRSYRLYKEKGLELRHKRPKRRISAAHREQVPMSASMDDCWSMDSVHAQLFDGRKIRCLTVVDNFSRNCPLIEVNHRVTGDDVVSSMDQLKEIHGRIPKRIKVDNGSEFISKALGKWTYENNVILCFSRPGKPTDECIH